MGYIMKRLCVIPVTNGSSCFLTIRDPLGHCFAVTFVCKLEVSNNVNGHSRPTYGTLQKNMADLAPPTGPRTVSGPGLIRQQKRTFKLVLRLVSGKKRRSS